MVAVCRSAFIAILDNAAAMTALNSNNQDMGFDALSKLQVVYQPLLQNG